MADIWCYCMCFETVTKQDCSCIEAVYSMHCVHLILDALEEMKITDWQREESRVFQGSESTTCPSKTQHDRITNQSPSIAF